jgi:PhzF family phenazine biosynthesis protein
MRQVQIFNVFTDQHNRGNPAAAVELSSWVADDELLAISQQYGQPVTAFVVKDRANFHIRWFSLMTEINLCGHGTLAAAALVFERYSLCDQPVVFNSPFGNLSVEKKGKGFSLLLPSWRGQEVTTDCDIVRSLAIEPLSMFKTRDLIVVLKDEQQVREFQPDLSLLTTMKDYHALIVTAKGEQCDYVLRYFPPKIGINEDPATGSAQCSLAAYWFDVLNKPILSVRQLSERGGAFLVEKNADNRIKVTAEVTLGELISN